MSRVLLRRLAASLPAPVRRVGRRVLRDRRRAAAPAPELWVSGAPRPDRLRERLRVYDRIREAGGITRGPSGWLIASHALLKDVLRDAGRFASAPVAYNPVLVGLDGEAHRSVRAPIVAAFSPRALRGRGDWIRSVARATLAAMPPPGQADLAFDYAEALPFRLTADLVGLEAVPTAELLTWSPHLHALAAHGSAGLHVEGSFRTTAEDLYQRAARGEPAPVLSALADSPRAMASADAFETALGLLFLASVRTTSGAISHAVHALLDHPEVEASLRRDRSRLPAVVDEVLRVRPIDEVVLRVAVEDTELGGVAIAAGELIQGLSEGVNHDPAVFAEPEAFRPGRGPQALTFGYGPHFCPGRFWAREEIVGALDVMLDAWASFGEAFDPGPAAPGPHLDRDLGPIVIRTAPRL